MKNHNHQYHNIYQYIVLIQKEKQDLQNQLVELFRTSDAKRLEVEHLRRELKQFKEKYDCTEEVVPTQSGDNLDHSQPNEKNVISNLDNEAAHLNSTQIIIKSKNIKNECNNESGVEKSKSSDNICLDSTGNIDYDLQAGPSGM